jgi:ATP-dependent protease ClpP protease subunit
MLQRITVGLVLLMALVLAEPGVAGPFEEGLTAYDQGQFDTAFRLWLPLAEQGHAAAQFNVAVMYENGSGIAQDSAEAARWYLAAAKQGDAEAQYKVGMLYETGTGVTKDLAEARKWYDALIATPRKDKVSLAAKQRARERLATMAPAAQEVIPYDGGRFVIVSSQEGKCVVALQGVINGDAKWKFDDVVTTSAKLGCDRPWVMLESPGGLVFDGFSLGRELRTHGFRTITRYECASACASIFLGGVERVLAGSRARIGLHQAALVYQDTRARKCDTVMDSPSMRDLRRYLAFVIPATSTQVMDVIRHTSCNDIEWTSGQRALDLGIATSLYSEDADIFGPEAARR